MSETEKNSEWVYVIVVDPGGKEHFLGLHDNKENSHFIPAFHSRDEAVACQYSLKLDEKEKYEIQAVIYSELVENVKKSGYKVATVDGHGRILKVA